MVNLLFQTRYSLPQPRGLTLTWCTPGERLATVYGLAPVRYLHNRYVFDKKVLLLTRRCLQSMCPILSSAHSNPLAMPVAVNSTVKFLPSTLQPRLMRYVIQYGSLASSLCTHSLLRITFLSPLTGSLATTRRV